MKLLPLDSDELVQRAAGWLAQEENFRWLDFGQGQQIVTPPALKIMTQRRTHVLRVYTADDEVPAGIVALENVNRKFRTATLWGVSDRSFRTRGYATFAASRLLTMGFEELDLHAINTWVVDGNPSRRIVERLNFRYCGRQREAHFLNGRPRDRLLFDLLASEHREIAPQDRPLRRRRSQARLAGA